MTTSPSSFDVGRLQLEALLAAIAPHGSPDDVLDLFDDLAPIVHARPVDAPPRWSALTDDCSPFELSIALTDDAPVVRVLVEAQQDPASAATYWAAGTRLTTWLADRIDLDLGRFHAIEALYRPTDPAAFWSLWHSVELRPDGPRIRIYLNPAAHGPLNAMNVVAATLDRLGLHGSLRAFANIADTLFWQPIVVTLDVTRDRNRIGLHLMIRDPSSEDLERLLALSPQAIPGDAAAVLAIMTGRERADLRPLFATLHLDPGGIGAVNLAVPCVPYTTDDADAAARITRLLSHFDQPDATYRRCLEALSPDPAQTEGVNSFVTFVRSHGRPQISVAFAARLYHPRYGWLAFDPPTWWPSPVAR